MAYLVLRRPRPGIWLLLSLLTSSLLATSASASIADTATLADTIRRDGLAARMLIRSGQQGDTARGSVDAIVDYPYSEVNRALASIRPWCEITFLHFNIKACVHHETDAGILVTLYSGRMHYLPPEDAFRNEYAFREEARDEQRLALSIEGANGPFGTRDYKIHIEAAPLDEQRSVLRLSYSVSYGLMTRTAQRLYFATAGRHRIGFSEEDGQPIRGLRGMMERNTMRFYLALQAYLEAPQEDALLQRLTRWHALTLEHPAQLKELSLEEYLHNKQREHLHQAALQAQADAS